MGKVWGKLGENCYVKFHADFKSVFDIQISAILREILPILY